MDEPMTPVPIQPIDVTPGATGLYIIMPGLIISRFMAPAGLPYCSLTSTTEHGVWLT